MSLCFRTECESEEAAIAVFHAIDGVFDDIEAHGWAKKCDGAALLWKFDDRPPVVGRMIEALRRRGQFSRIEEIPESEFWSARSCSV